ncbi:dockerin type I domain-containing protein [Candidatus Bipolaricaulota bacterium]
MRQAHATVTSGVKRLGLLVVTASLALVLTSCDDVNGDGAIDLLDVVLCAQIARGLVAGTPQQRAAADVDGDGDVDIDDVTMLSDYILATGGAP